MPWGSNIFPLLIVTASGGFTGLFVYSPGPGPGNLVYSVTGMAGTDPYGNAFVPTATAYGTISGTIFNTPAIVHATSFNPASGVISPTVTIPATTAGNTLVVCYGAAASGANPTVSSILLGSAALSANQTVGALVSDDCETWDLIGIAAGQTTVTITATAGTGTQVCAGWVFEVSNIAARDQHSTNANATAAAAWTSGATPTLSQAAEIGVGFVIANQTALTITGPASPWSNQAQVNGAALGMAVVAGTDVVSSTAALTYAGTFAPNAAQAVVLVTYKATSSTVTYKSEIQEGISGGVLLENFITGSPNEATPGQFKAGVINTGQPNETIELIIGGPVNTVSNDGAFISLNSSASNAASTASGNLEYQLAAGGDITLLTWNANGVNRLSAAGLAGSVPLYLTDAFSRTVTATGVNAITFGYSIPANDPILLAAHQATVYRLRAWGTGSEPGAGEQGLTFTLQCFGLNQTLVSNYGPAAAGHTFTWLVDAWVMVTALGSSGSAIIGGLLTNFDAATPASTVIPFSIASFTVNTTAAWTFSLAAGWAAVTGGPSVTCPASVFVREGT